MRKRKRRGFPIFCALELGFFLVAGLAARAPLYASVVSVRVSDWNTYHARFRYDVDGLTISAVLSDSDGVRSTRGSATIGGGPVVISVGAVAVHGLLVELENPADGGARSDATVTRTRVRSDHSFDPARRVGVAARGSFAGADVFVWGAGLPDAPHRYGVGFSRDRAVRIEAVSILSPRVPVESLDVWYTGTTASPGGTEIHAAARISAENRTARGAVRPYRFSGSAAAFASSGTRSLGGYAARIAGTGETRAINGEIWLGVRSPLYRPPSGRTGANAVASARLSVSPRDWITPAVAVERRVWFPDAYGSGDRDDLRTRVSVFSRTPDDRKHGVSGELAIERRTERPHDQDVETRGEATARLRVNRVTVTGEILTVKRPNGVRTGKYVVSSAIRSPGFTFELSTRLDTGTVPSYGGRARLEVTRPARTAFISIATRKPVRIDDAVRLLTIDDARRAFVIEFGFSGR